MTKKVVHERPHTRSRLCQVNYWKQTTTITMLGFKGIKIIPRATHVAGTSALKLNAPKVINKQFHNPTTRISTTFKTNFAKDSTSTLALKRYFSSDGKQNKNNNQNQNQQEQNENKTQYEEIFSPTGGPDPVERKRTWKTEVLSFSEGAIFLMAAYLLGYYSVVCCHLRLAF